MDKRGTCRKSSFPLSLWKRTLRSAPTECGSSQNTLRQEIPHSQMRFKELWPSERSYSNPVSANRFPASPFCASVLLFQRTLYFIYSTEQGFAGLLLITCRRAPGTVCSTWRWLLIVKHISLCFWCIRRHSMAAVGQNSKRQEYNVDFKWLACSFVIERFEKTAGKYIFVVLIACSAAPCSAGCRAWRR